MPLPPLALGSPAAKWRWIRQGRIRVDWAVVTSPSRELQSGERVQLEGRGELVLDRADRTKRDRWRLQLTRRR